MKQHDTSVPSSGRQMSLVFEPRRVDEINDVERAEAITTLAQLLMQAAGLTVGPPDAKPRGTRLRTPCCQGTKVAITVALANLTE